MCTQMDGSPCNIKAPCLAMPNAPLLYCSSRPPGSPAIGSSLKVTLQSGHTDVAGLAVGLKPALTPPKIHLNPTPHHPPLLSLLASSLPSTNQILPCYPHHLKKNQSPYAPFAQPGHANIQASCCLGSMLL